MAKGIIYVMTTVVPGLIKIGKTGSTNFESRMYQLERHGYSNVVGLKRYFAIEVDDYDEKEQLLQAIFSKSKLENSELFALDVNLAVQLLSSFEGKQVYPVDTTKEEVFDDASEKRGTSAIPNGIYYFNRKIKAWGKNATGKMKVENGKFIVLKGSICCPIRGKGWTSTKQIDLKRESSPFKGDTLQVDVEFTSPSLAAAFITYKPENGWTEWKTESGDPIDKYRR